MTSAARVAFSALLGIVLYLILAAVLKQYLYTTAPDPDMVRPMWQTLFYGVLLGLRDVMPAFLVGWLVRERGWLVASLVAFLAYPLEIGLIDGYWQNRETLPVTAAMSLHAAIIGAVGGAAGEFARTWRPSNNSFKPKPLRGSV